MSLTVEEAINMLSEEYKKLGSSDKIRKLAEMKLLNQENFNTVFNGPLDEVTTRFNQLVLKNNPKISKKTYVEIDSPDRKDVRFGTPDPRLTYQLKAKDYIPLIEHYKNKLKIDLRLNLQDDVESDRTLDNEKRLKEISEIAEEVKRTNKPVAYFVTYDGKGDDKRHFEVIIITPTHLIRPLMYNMRKHPVIHGYPSLSQ